MKFTIILLAIAVAAGAVAAQSFETGSSSSSPNYFLVSRASAGGTLCASTKFVGAMSLGDGVSAMPAKSTNFALAGGIPATYDVTSKGSPWLSSASPGYVTPKGGATVEILVTGLDVGNNPTVKIGGQTATVLSKSNHRLTVRLPFQPVPGWQSVELTNGGGVSSLATGVGVLPIMHNDPGATPDAPFELVFKGKPNDQVIWALGIGEAPPTALPGFLYGLALNPAVLLIMPGFTLPASGELRMRIPASSYVRPIYAQAVFASTDPGYAPGSFSSVLRF